MLLPSLVVAGDPQFWSPVSNGKTLSKTSVPSKLNWWTKPALSEETIWSPIIAAEEISSPETSAGKPAWCSDTLTSNIKFASNA